jgi:ribosomal-protein-alanine N-acetyltransferase
VGDRSLHGPGLTLRAGRPADTPFVVSLGEAAFARFGDYGPVMQAFLDSPDVLAFIAELEGEAVGFALVEWPPVQPDIADLVAIAVAPGYRRTGVGRALLRHVIASRALLREPSLLVLTVADDNDAAIALFRSEGFGMIPGAIGRYAGGQTSRLMGKPVRPRG